jgi:hypothetical protein
MPGLHCVGNEWHVKLVRLKSRSGWSEVREKSYRAPNFARKPIAIGSDRTGRADLPAHRTLRFGGKVQLIRSRHVLEPEPMRGCVSSLFGQGSSPLTLLVVHELSHSALGVPCTDGTSMQDEQSARCGRTPSGLAKYRETIPQSYSHRPSETCGGSANILRVISSRIVLNFLGGAL